MASPAAAAKPEQGERPATGGGSAATTPTAASGAGAERDDRAEAGGRTPARQVAFQALIAAEVTAATLRAQLADAEADVVVLRNKLRATVRQQWGHLPDGAASSSGDVAQYSQSESNAGVGHELSTVAACGGQGAARRSHAKSAAPRTPFASPCPVTPVPAPRAPAPADGGATPAASPMVPKRTTAARSPSVGAGRVCHGAGASSTCAADFAAPRAVSPAPVARAAAAGQSAEPGGAPAPPSVPVAVPQSEGMADVAGAVRRCKRMRSVVWPEHWVKTEYRPGGKRPADACLGCWWIFNDYPKHRQHEAGKCLKQPSRS